MREARVNNPERIFLGRITRLFNEIYPDSGLYLLAESDFSQLKNTITQRKIVNRPDIKISFDKL